MLKHSFAIAALVALGNASFAIGQGGFEHEPINYFKVEPSDPVSRLQRRIHDGDVTLEFDHRFGYLRSILAALDIPVNSQTLVFSKTSLQLHRITPATPRALYFNDDVYVGYCHKGDVLEFAATDAEQGAMFYTLLQQPDESPKILRDKGGCLSCHASHRTRNVPGYLLRSVFPDAVGQPQLGLGSFTNDHSSTFQERWGGWYVTGDHGAMRHMGNTVCHTDDREFDREPGANRTELSAYFDTSNYLRSDSDIVALMVLGHQTRMHNEIAAANYEARQAVHQSRQMNELLNRPTDYVSESAKRRIATSAQRVLDCLLYCDEFVLTDQVSSTSTFARDFAARGKRDSENRSLRDFDLRKRLFKYPCSFLIYSSAFAALPDAIRTQVLLRLNDILEGRDQNPQFAHLTAEMRADMLEILLDTLPELTTIRAGIGE
jgi:hypothetical protein